MPNDWEQFDFYRVLDVPSNAGDEEIKNAHANLTSTLNPDAKPDEQKRAAAVAFVIADAAFAALSDKSIRGVFDAKVSEIQKAESERDKIETQRKGKLQEQQSVEEDEKLKRAMLRYDSAKKDLADFYYEHVFKAARNSHFETTSADKLLEWLSSERAESLRKAEQKGRKISFRIEWEGFGAVQSMRKKRSEEIVKIVDVLAERLQL
ncbi:DnaJ domain-containing protein [Candidatus Poribacteria bacterium]|nr:DnaJ domain-containing protein [Candidatus Poribacteria bacterium]